MKREIKFRTYYKKDDVKNKKMEISTLKEVCEHGEDDFEDFIYMQYTGLKDKNGVEIYEGDIVAIDEPKIKYKVVFEDGAFIFKGEYTYHPLYEADFFEVIGNIWENKDLLE